VQSYEKTRAKQKKLISFFAECRGVSLSKAKNFADFSAKLRKNEGKTKETHFFF